MKSHNLLPGLRADLRDLSIQLVSSVLRTCCEACRGMQIDGMLLSVAGTPSTESINACEY